MRVWDRVEACLRWIEHDRWPLFMVVEAECGCREKTEWGTAGQETIDYGRRTGTVCKQASQGICMTPRLDVAKGRRTDSVLHRRS